MFLLHWLPAPRFVWGVLPVELMEAMMWYLQLFMTSLASDGANRLDQEWKLQNQCKTMNFAKCTLVEYFLGQLSCFSCMFSLISCQPGRCSVPFPKSKMGTRSHHVQTHWAWTYILIWVWHGPHVESWFSSFIFGEKTENIHFDPYEAAKLVRQTEITP